MHFESEDSVGAPPFIGAPKPLAGLHREEFIVILQNTDKERAIQIADSIRSKCSFLELEYRSQPLPRITLSVGVSLLDAQISTPEQLLSVADMALYAAKKNGRDHVVVAADPSVDDGATPRPKVAVLFSAT